MVHLEQGDAWQIPGRAPTPFNWAACAGRNPDQLGRWCRFEDINAGAYDVEARLASLDLDGIDAEVLFPNGLDWVIEAPDVEFHLAMVRLYNDFLRGVLRERPDRFGGCALLPARGADHTIAEIERLADKPGIVAWLLKTYPHGDSTLAPEDDPVWAAAEASGKPITIHVSLRAATSFRLDAMALPGTFHFYDTPARVLEFIFSGVLDRYPRLQVFLAEIDCGWLPYFAQQADDNYVAPHALGAARRRAARMPSKYIRRAFPGLVHHRPVRHRQPPRGRGRADALVQ